jgi:hypothetical protein
LFAGVFQLMRNLIAVLFVSAAMAASALAQAADNIVHKELSQAEIDRIIKKTTENEGDFRVALRSYAFKRFATINTIGLGGQISGTYRRDSFMTFNAAGERFEKIIFFPVATVPPGMVTAEDLEDLGGVNPFALEPSLASQYKFNYVGVERIDDLNLYVFDVSPKIMPKAEKGAKRFFTGRIWIDVDDLMIVKSRGKGIPEYKDNKFPVVETTRQQIDGKYWFPADARADDELVFENGSVLRLRIRVKYTDYAVGRSEVRILDDVPDPTPTPSPTPKKP